MARSGDRCSSDPPTYRCNQPEYFTSGGNAGFCAACSAIDRARVIVVTSKCLLRTDINCTKDQFAPTSLPLHSKPANWAQTVTLRHKPIASESPDTYAAYRMGAVTRELFGLMSGSTVCKNSLGTRSSPYRVNSPCVTNISHATSSGSRTQDFDEIA